MATKELIFGRISKMVAEFMIYETCKPAKFHNYVQMAKNIDHMRSMLPEMGLMTFIAVSSILPRKDDDLTLIVGAVLFDCNDSFKVTVEVPNGESVTGMEILTGFIVVVCTSYSGRLVLTDASFTNNYNHILGDGREHVVSLPDAAYVCPEKALQDEDLIP